MKMRVKTIVLPLVALLPLTVSAQERMPDPAGMPAAASSTPVCPKTPAALPVDLVGWSAPSTDRAMTKYYPRAHWLRGLNTRLTLSPISGVAFVVPPEKAIEPNLYGGLMSVNVQKAGRLKIALGGRAWVDVARSSGTSGKSWQTVPSVGHAHGPDCSGIAKIVDYDVAPGRYVIQIVNAPSATIQAMAVAPR